MPLGDLVALHQDALRILAGGGVEAVRELLRTLPGTLRMEVRYEAGVGCGLGVDLEGVFEGEICGSLMLTDRGPELEQELAAAVQSAPHLLESGPLGSVVDLHGYFAELRTAVVAVAGR